MLSTQLVSNDWEHVIMWKNRYCGHLLGSDWTLERRKCNDKIICLDHPAYKWCNTYTWPQTSLMDFVLLCLLIWLQINSVDIPNKILNTPHTALRRGKNYGWWDDLIRLINSDVFMTFSCLTFVVFWCFYAFTSVFLIVLNRFGQTTQLDFERGRRCCSSPKLKSPQDRRSR